MIILTQGDITREDVDVIVNAANSQLKGGGGVDGAIHRAAGHGVMEECRKIGACPTGQAVITNAGKLKARKIIHTVGPVWQGGSHGEPLFLKSAYENSFILALQHHLKSIAFPAISTGVYGYPKEDAALIALNMGLRFEGDFDRIVYVCFSEDDYSIYQTAWTKIKVLS
jgi:O-acetyl-ADP-ribose deacetylase (regulator of RNase III)